MSILIIGGGIAGSATAFYLARHGRDVTVLERNEIASEASGVNAGGVGGKGWGASPTLLDAITTGGLALFQELQLDLGYDLEFRQCGELVAIQTEAEYIYAQDEVQRLRAQGYQVELLSTRQARGLEPELTSALLGAIYTLLRGQADPVKTTRAFADAAQRAGARIVTSCAVTAIEQQHDDTYRVQTSQGVFECERLVIAAGAWSARIGEMLDLRIPIVPVRGQMWATEPLPPTIFTFIAAVESSLQWHRTPGHTESEPPNLTHRNGARVTRHLYGRQRRNGEIIFGGDRELVGYDKTPNPAGIEVNREQATEILPGLRSLPIARTWAGLMPFSLDGKPLIGAIPQRRNLFIVSGLASSGFGRGPMAGKLLADLLHSGAKPDFLAEADPARCVIELDSATDERR